MASEIRELKRVLAGMKSRIDQVLTSAEKRKLLKDIATGVITDPNSLRAYVGRIEGIKRKKSQEQTAKLSGKVIDANNRTPIASVDVTIQQTNFKEKTDTSGNFIWEGLVKGRTIRINSVAPGFKPNQTEYQATMENEQYVVVKMVSIQTGGKARAQEEKEKMKKGH